MRAGGVWRSLPALCDEGRFILASPQGRGVADALFDIFPGVAGVFRPGWARRRAAHRRATAVRILSPSRTPWSQGAPGAYPFRIELALAADDRSWHYSSLAFRGGQLVEATRDCCHDGGDRNSPILGHAFHLTVEGGTNRGTGLRVAGAGPGHRELIG